MNRDGTNCLYGMIAVRHGKHASLVAPDFYSRNAVVSYYPPTYNDNQLDFIAWVGHLWHCPYLQYMLTAF